MFGISSVAQDRAVRRGEVLLDRPVDRHVSLQLQYGFSIGIIISSQLQQGFTTGICSAGTDRGMMVASQTITTTATMNSPMNPAALSFCRPVAGRPCGGGAVQSWPTAAAIPVDNPCCSCRLTRELTWGEAAASLGIGPVG